MMSNNRAEYGSASEWLSALRQDEAWLCQLQRLQDSAPADIGAHRDDALRRIGRGETFEFWEIYQHQVEPVVAEVWGIAELSLPKLKIQAIGMLSMEWIEQQKRDGLGEDEKLTTEKAKNYWQRLQQAGFVDANHKLLSDTTRKQAMLIAEALAERLHLKAKWKPFERLWGIKNLAQEKWDYLENGIDPPRKDDIDAIFRS